MGKSIIVAERDNIAAVMENGRVAEFYVHRGEILFCENITKEFIFILYIIIKKNGIP